MSLWSRGGNSCALTVGTLAALGLITAAAPAHADAPASVPFLRKKPISIKLGVLFPSDTKLKSDRFSVDGGSGLQSTLFDGEVGYDFYKTNALQPVILQGYLGYFTSDKNDQGTKVNLDTFNFGINGRTYFGIPLAPVKPYVGLGLGIYSQRFKTSFDGDSFSKTQTDLGGKIFAGVETKKGLFGEIEYRFLQDAKVTVPVVADETTQTLKANASGFGIHVGIHL